MMRSRKGRPPGSVNAIHKRVRAIAQQILGSQEYVASLNARIKDGTLPPAMETLLWHYAYGKPRDQIQLTVMDERLEAAPVEDLEERARLVIDRISRAREKIKAQGAQPAPQLPVINADFRPTHDEPLADTLDDLEFIPQARRLVAKQTKQVREAKTLLGLDNVVRRETEPMTSEELAQLEAHDEEGEE